MSEPSRSRTKDFLTGAAVGGLAGLIIKDLDLTTAVSYWGRLAPLVTAVTLLGALTWLTRLRTLCGLAAAALGVLWIAVAFTPLTHWLARDLPRNDTLAKADAVFVLASGLQADGEFSSSSMSRLIKGFEVIGEGWAPRLILSELREPHPRYRDSASKLATSLGIEVDIVTVGPVRNTRDEAVAVAALAREKAYERVIVVTSPTHTRRASAALEAEGVDVISVSSQQVYYDFEKLSDPLETDNHLRAFRFILHERIGLVYYRSRGWIQ